jgi:hypothetical protein
VSKLTFKVSSANDASLISLLKKISLLACNFKIIPAENLVIVTALDDTMIGPIINLVSTYYNVLEIEVEN